MTAMQDDDLDRLLAAAARTAPQPTAALLDRVLADALALQPSAPSARAPIRDSLWSRLTAALGGPPALAGVGTAAVFGLALGYLSPAMADYLTGTTAEAAEFFPEADFQTTEG
jgi:hypothetical protein